MFRSTRCSRTLAAALLGSLALTGCSDSDAASAEQLAAANAAADRAEQAAKRAEQAAKRAEAAAARASRGSPAPALAAEPEPVTDALAAPDEAAAGEADDAG